MLWWWLSPCPCNNAVTVSIWPGSYPLRRLAVIMINAMVAVSVSRKKSLLTHLEVNSRTVSSSPVCTANIYPQVRDRPLAVLSHISPMRSVKVYCTNGLPVCVFSNLPAILVWVIVISHPDCLTCPLTLQLFQALSLIHNHTEKSFFFQKKPTVVIWLLSWKPQWHSLSLGWRATASVVSKALDNLNTHVPQSIPDATPAARAFSSSPDPVTGLLTSEVYTSCFFYSSFPPQLGYRIN